MPSTWDGSPLQQAASWGELETVIGVDDGI
jgi:hypothetical protein